MSKTTPIPPATLAWAVRVTSRQQGRSYLLSGSNDAPVALCPTRKQAAEAVALFRRLGFTSLRPTVVRVEVMVVEAKRQKAGKVTP